MKTHAFPYQLAQEAILLGRYADAIDLLKPLSANDDPDAQFLHAYLHFWDDNLSRIEALDRMIYLANTGHPEANYILAICPDLSPGYQFSLPKRDEQLNRLKMAAEQGSVYALTDLAQCHIEGLFNNSSLETARMLLDDAIQKDIYGNGYAKLGFLAGCMKMRGVGGDVNTREGLRNLSRSHKFQNSPGFEYSPLISNILDIGLDMLKRSEVDVALSDWKFYRKELDSEIQRIADVEEKVRSKSKSQWESFVQLYCKRTLSYDLRDADFDAYSDFIFDHFIYPEHQEDIFMWCGCGSKENRIDGKKLLHNYTGFFKNPGDWQQRYSIVQIKQLLENQDKNSMFSWPIMDTIFHPHLNTTVEDAVDCIQAMVGLYESIFQEQDFKEIGHNWWRNVSYRYASVYGRKFSEEEMEYIELAFVDTMVQVLNMKSLDCQKAAIHGLGHSRFSKKDEILQKYIDEHPEHPAWILEYARAGIEGRV